jgi:hypothetical protein
LLEEVLYNLLYLYKISVNVSETSSGGGLPHTAGVKIASIVCHSIALKEHQEKEEMDTDSIATSAEVPILQAPILKASILEAPILEPETLPDDPHHILSEALHRIQTACPEAEDLEWRAKVFRFVFNFTERYGPNSLLRNVVCAQFNLDVRAFDLYSRYPELVERLEQARLALFKRPPESNPDPATLWPHALKVFFVIYRVGAIRHGRLLLWVARRTPTWWVHKAADFLTESGLIETYHVAGRNPRHLSRWYRLATGLSDAAIANG